MSIINKKDMSKYLEQTNIINFKNKNILILANSLAKGCTKDVQVAKNCFTYVRDNIKHSGDYKDNITTYIASDVLKYKTGWCYSKSHLLAALLRANNIPCGFSYQRLSCNEYTNNSYCLHGLNSIYLKHFGWIRVDARGNKDGVNAQFDPLFEQLAFKLQENEYNIEGVFHKPLDEVINTLKTNKTYNEMINNFPDIKKKTS